MSTRTSRRQLTSMNEPVQERKLDPSCTDNTVSPNIILSGELFCEEQLPVLEEEECHLSRILKLKKTISGSLWNLFMDLMEESETLLDLVKIECAPSLNNLMRLQWVVYEIKQELVYMQPSLKRKMMEQLIEEESKKNSNINGKEYTVAMQENQQPNSGTI